MVKKSGVVVKAKKAKKSVSSDKKKADSDKLKQGIITKDMLLSEIASKHPGALEVMFNHGMHCIGCGMAAFETLEQGCLAHGMSNKDIEKLVKEMNNCISKK